MLRGLLCIVVLLMAGAIGNAFNETQLMHINLKSLVLLTTIRGDIHAIDSETGKEVWRSSLGEPLLETRYSKATGMEEFIEQLNENNRTVLIPLADGKVVSYTPGQGFQVWI